MAAFLCGALNYQSVHHLFPCVSQYHYPALSGVVRRVARKWGVRYNYVGSFGRRLNCIYSICRRWVWRMCTSIELVWSVWRGVAGVREGRVGVSVCSVCGCVVV